jgi:hypothetical protein
MNELDDLKSLTATGIEVGSGAEEELSTQVAGLFYRFPPNSITVVNDRTEYPKDPKGMYHLIDRPPVVSEGWDAKNVVKHILDEIRLGGKGLYIVKGDGRDEERRKLARGQWIQWRMSKAQAVQSNWVKKVEDARNTPGASIPRPEDDVRREMNFIRDHASEIAVSDRKRYLCTLDGMDFDTSEECAEHIRQFFGHRLKEQNATPDRFIEDTEVDLEAARKAGAVARARQKSVTVSVNPSNDPQRGAAVLQKAKDMGVKLTKAENKGLSEGDLSVIETVEQALGAQETVSA